MDVQTIDQQYQQLQTQAQGTAQELSNLASKLKAVAQTGNQDAREWMLDLKSIALAMQTEQNQVICCCRRCMGSSPIRRRRCRRLPRSRRAHGGSNNPWRRKAINPDTDSRRWAGSAACWAVS